MYSVATTVNTEATGADTQIFVGITEDFGWTINKRPYNCKTPTLFRIGVQNFDRATKITDLKFRLPTANRYLMKKLKTNDKTVVDNAIKAGIIKEVIGIQERNAARTYAANHVN